MDDILKYPTIDEISELFVEEFVAKHSDLSYGYFFVCLDTKKQSKNISNFEPRHGIRMLAKAMKTEMDYLKDKYPEIPFEEHYLPIYNLLKIMFSEEKKLNEHLLKEKTIDS
jgi:hypothetical protein